MNRMKLHQLDSSAMADGTVLVAVGGTLIVTTLGDGVTVDLTDPAHPILKTTRPIALVLGATDPLPGGLANNTPIIRRT